MMSGIRATHTTPELVVRRHLHREGFRYRLHKAKLPGRPDIVLTRYNAVVFVHGCFWHAHEDCRYFKIPGSRVDFWTAKLEGNRARDARNVSRLLDDGWRVAIVWECFTRQENADLPRLVRWISGDEPNLVLKG